MPKYNILTKLNLDAKAELLSKRAKNHASSNGITTDQVNVKPLVKHVLSKELQMYFERITEAVLSEDERLQSQAFESLRSDPGLHQLLPYFVQHIHKKVTQNHKNLDVLEAMLSMAFSLLNNKHLFVEPYVCKFHYRLNIKLTIPIASSIDSSYSFLFGRSYHLRKPANTRPLVYSSTCRYIDC